MKQKSILFLISLFAIIIVSCKKELPPAPTHPARTNGTAGTNALGFDAEVYSFKDIYLDGISSSSDYHSAIFFGSAPTSSNVPSINAGIVSINGIVLKMDSSSNPGPVYADTTFSIPGTTYQINVAGSSQFPAGTLQYGQNSPVFTDTTLIPSSITLNSGISLVFHNCISADSASVTISDYNGNSFSKKYGITNNQLNLSVTAAELSSLTATPYGNISIDLVNITTTAVGSKNYLVILERRYNKLNIQLN